MDRTRRAAWLALLVGVLMTTSVSAGDHPWSRWSCPRSSYSPCNYLTPGLWQAWTFTQRDNTYLYAANPYPEIPLHYQELRYRCPTVPPRDYPYPPFDLNPRQPQDAPAEPAFPYPADLP